MRSVRDMTTNTDGSSALPFSRLVIVHGFGAAPSDHWFPWLAAQATTAVVPELPSPLAPSAGAWITRTAEAIGRLDAETAVVAHSLGNPTALAAVRQLQQAGDHGSLGAFVAVAPFLAPLPPVGDEDLDGFIRTGLGDFLTGLGPAALKPALGPVRVIRSSADPLVPADLSDEVAAAFDSPVSVVPRAGHFLASDGVESLPAVLEALRSAR